MRRLALLLTLTLPAFGAGCVADDPPPNRPVERAVPEPSADGAREGWEAADTALGERVYVPIYSHIYFRNSSRDIDLAATLSIRNTDDAAPIRVTAVRYYDSAGALVRRYLDAPQVVGPMASTYFLIEERDDTGGVGANFIVEWTADRAVTPPVIEAVMIGTASAQGISFVTQGRVLHRARSAPGSPEESPVEPPAAEPNE